MLNFSLFCPDIITEFAIYTLWFSVLPYKTVYVYKHSIENCLIHYYQLYLKIALYELYLWQHAGGVISLPPHSKTFLGFNFPVVWVLSVQSFHVLHMPVWVSSHNSTHREWFSVCNCKWLFIFVLALR